MLWKVLTYLSLGEGMQELSALLCNFSAKLKICQNIKIRNLAAEKMICSPFAPDHKSHGGLLSVPGMDF